MGLKGKVGGGEVEVVFVQLRGSKDKPCNGYHHWRKQQDVVRTAAGSQGNVKPRLSAQKLRMSYKEKCEFEQLEKEIEQLTKEKESIEKALSSGKISVEEITAMSKRLPVLNDELDTKEMRWLELSEKA